MEKEKLVASLQEFISSSEHSVDLYFIFKNGDSFKQYLSDPDDTLRDKLINEYISSLSIFIDPENNFELNDVYDDNEYEDYHLFYDNVENNEIALAIFQFDRAETLPYTTDIGSFSRIYGFLIEISNGDENLTIYKRNQPTNAVNPKNVINFVTGNDNKLKLISQNTIYINKSVDLFKIGDIIYINSRRVYEHQFGFVAELRRNAEKGFMDLVGTGAFDFKEELHESMKRFPKSELKKLSKLMKNNPIIEKQNWKAITRQAKRYAKHEFQTSDDGLISISSQKELKILISILNRDYNINDASRERFLTKNKKLIK